MPRYPEIRAVQQSRHHDRLVRLCCICNQLQSVMRLMYGFAVPGLLRRLYSGPARHCRAILVHKSPDSAGTDCKLACKAVHALDGTTGMSKKATQSGAICECLLGTRKLRRNVAARETYALHLPPPRHPAGETTIHVCTCRHLKKKVRNKEV